MDGEALSLSWSLVRFRDLTVGPACWPMCTLGRFLGIKYIPAHAELLPAAVLTGQQEQHHHQATVTATHLQSRLQRHNKQASLSKGALAGPACGPSVQVNCCRPKAVLAGCAGPNTCPSHSREIKVPGGRVRQAYQVVSSCFEASLPLLNEECVAA